MKKYLSLRVLLCALIFVINLGLFHNAYAQGEIVKPFTTRTSPGVMNVRGDFALTGNSVLTTNATLTNSSTNSNEVMKFIDADNDATTVNSSSAELLFRTENNSVPECTNVRWAGLYWIGRTSADGYTFTDTSTQYSTTTGLVRDTFNGESLRHGQSAFNNTITFNFPINPTTGLNNSNRRIFTGTYSNVEYSFVTFEISGTLFLFGTNNGQQSNRVLLRNYTISGTTNYTVIGTVVPATFTTAGGGGTPSAIIATLSTPYQLRNSNDTTLYLRTIRRPYSTTFNDLNNISEFRGTGSGNSNVRIDWSAASSRTGIITTRTLLSKTLDKRSVRLKLPGRSNYYTVTANTSNIHFPNSSNQSGIYSAFVDVTDSVRKAGSGMYWVADVAASTGNGGSAGYFGGWTLVVIYENNKMEYRDISVFDGYAYMQSNANNAVFTYDIPVSGFKARQNGPVNVKLGYIAGEGDRSIEGDIFQIKRRNSTVFDTLSPYGNTSFKNNFFHSAIQIAPATRTPNFTNNTGLDLGVIQIPNETKTYISNNDESTVIRVGTNQDLYSIPLFVLAVDAYVPEMSPINQIASINDTLYDPVAHDTIYPLDTIEYKLVLQNTGSETINDVDIKIALPLAVNMLMEPRTINGVTTYVPSLQTTYIDPLTVGFPVATFDSTEGVRGTINWGIIDSFRRPARLGDTFAILTYKVVATNDCYVLMNPECAPKASVDGYAKGVGAISKVTIDSLPFIFGFQQTGACQGDPITEPQQLVIYGTDYVLQNCGNDIALKTYTKCVGVNSQYVVAMDSLLPYFPNGSIYTNGYPTYTTEYTTGLPFPAGLNDTLYYYAIPPAGAEECYFKIMVTNYQQPDTFMHRYDCKEAWVELRTDVPSSLIPKYTILSTYRAGVVRNPVPQSNTTGMFTGLRGVDSIVYTIENRQCAMSPIGVIFPDCNGALPVDFQSFTAIKNGGIVKLDWIAANEVDVKYYVVEHSINGTEFKSIGSVLPQQSQDVLKHYTLLHKTPNPGINYYRIKEVDLNDVGSYSIVKIVDFDKDFTVDIYPNPATEFINVKVQSKQNQNWSYWVSNATMQQVTDLKINENLLSNNEVSVDISSLANGIYFINILMEDGAIFNYKFVVQK